VHENESIYIPIGSVHRLANQGRIPLELIEVQTGSCSPGGRLQARLSGHRAKRKTRRVPGFSSKI
jgi:mannose-6-phosphate isomerase-like protein (cupin superfamily)